MAKGEVLKGLAPRSSREAAMTFQAIRDRGHGSVPQSEKSENPQFRARMQAAAQTIWLNPSKIVPFAVSAGVAAGLFAGIKYGFYSYLHSRLEPPYNKSPMSSAYWLNGADAVAAVVVTGIFAICIYDSKEARIKDKIKRKAKPGIKYPYTVPGSIEQAYRTGEVQPRRQQFYVRGQVRQRPLHI